MFIEFTNFINFMRLIIIKINNFYTNLLNYELPHNL